MYRALLTSLRKQYQLVRTIVFFVLLPIVALYALIVLQPFVPFSALLRDPTTITAKPQGTLTFYWGALSNLGILLWWAAAIVYGYSAYLSRRRKFRAEAERAFFVYFAVFTGLLALDDLFMIHEEILPVALGVPEAIIYALYGVLSIGLLRFHRTILRADFLVLGLAFGFFAVSILADQVGGPGLTGIGLLIEDLTKILGIVCWLIFAVSISEQLLKCGEGEEKVRAVTGKITVGSGGEKALWLRQMAHTKRLQGDYVGAQALEKRLTK